MTLLNILDKMYSYQHFSTILIATIATLVILFIVVLIKGIKDSKKEETVEVKKEEIKDITFEKIEEPAIITEDVTFEVPSLTKNLEDFKKSLEEELQKESQTLAESDKPFRVTGINELEDTVVLSKLSTPTEEKTKETYSKDQINSVTIDKISNTMVELPLLKETGISDSNVL